MTNGIPFYAASRALHETYGTHPDVCLHCIRGLADALHCRAQGDVAGPRLRDMPTDEQDAWLQEAFERFVLSRQAEAWERGHKGCSCDRPGSRLHCLNPYEAVFK